MELSEMIECMTTREDFVRFTKELYNDYRQNSESWENDNLGSYLEAMTAWVEDMDGFFMNTRQPLPDKSDWKLMANILYAARMYE